MVVPTEPPQVPESAGSGLAGETVGDAWAFRPEDGGGAWPGGLDYRQVIPIRWPRSIGWSVSGPRPVALGKRRAMAACSVRGSRAMRSCFPAAG